MKRFKQLRIFGDATAAKGLLEALKSKKNKVFEYNRIMTEDYATNIFRDISDVGCFKTSRVSLFQSSVWVIYDNSHLYVTNITSEINSALSKIEYNQVLDAFVNDYVRPVMQEDYKNLAIIMTPGDLEMSDLVSENSCKMLEQWQASYDKNYIEEDFVSYNYWIKAIVTLIKNNDVIEYDDLKGWLIEDCGWSEMLEDKIHDFYLSYELGKDVLNEWINENEG